MNRRRPERLADLLPGVVADLANRHHLNGAPPMTTKFRKKPLVVEARQLTRDNAREVWEWINGKAYYESDGSISGLTIFTLKGRVKAEFGDWIIRGAEGDFWPVTPDIFAATYEPVDGAA